MPQSIFEAYLGGAATPLYGAHFADAPARRAAVARACGRPLDGRVAGVLQRQNAAYATSAARDDNLRALRDGAAAVVTGQQVGLFVGPLFNLYKAATAIAAARAMSRESGTAVVPVFWLQTEDHDLPEIAEIRVLSSHPRRLCVAASPDERISLAHRTLPPEIDDCLAQLHQDLAGLPYADEHLQRLRRHYRPGRRWASAFGGVLAELFAPEGLVLIDPRDEELAAVAAPVHRRALQEAATLADALVQRTSELENAGYPATVHVREGAPLAFFHPHGSEGPRYRLEPRDGRFAEVGGTGSHSLQDLLAALEQDPLRFSSSALLRPVVQDALLPTAAYVGGPGEVAYFAQLAPLYAACGMAMPLVVPRARIRLIEERARRVLARLGLHADDLGRSDDAILAAAGMAATQENPAAELLRSFDAALDRCRADIESAGPGLPDALAKTHATVERALLRLAEKIERARLYRDQSLVEDVRRLRTWLRPEGQPQERYYGLAYFAARYGERAVLETVLHAIDPFAGAAIDVDLGEPSPAAAAAAGRTMSASVTGAR
ncbi:MAG TPA: bacillithiol biosynthesis cysteine-adding enzyme BshC [Candidatus Limnocylindrales bacterium]|nr:bacillithiol biosynthesis cysteine-adding enzyme BshC [Candidatus Limnocylindrales bacterium]